MRKQKIITCKHVKSTKIKNKRPLTLNYIQTGINVKSNINLSFVNHDRTKINLKSNALCLTACPREQQHSRQLLNTLYDNLKRASYYDLIYSSKIKEIPKLLLYDLLAKNQVF